MHDDLFERAEALKEEHFALETEFNELEKCEEKLEQDVLDGTIDEKEHLSRLTKLADAYQDVAERMQALSNELTYIYQLITG